MRRITEEGIIQAGYYLGEHISGVPSIYLQWATACMNPKESDEYEMIAAARSELRRRVIDG